MRDTLWRSGVSESGMICVAEFNRARNTVRAFPLHYYSEPDDHNTAAFLISDDQPPLAAVAGHSSDNYVYVRVGGAPYALDSLGPRVAVDFGATTTYAQLIRRPGTSTVALLTRSVNNWLCKVSDDWGASWGATQTLWSATYASRGIDSDGLMHYVLSPHPTQASQTYLRYLRVDPASGDIRAAVGPSLGNIWSGGIAGIDDAATATPVSDLGVGSGIGRRVLDTAPDGSFIVCEFRKAAAGSGGPLKVIKRISVNAWTEIDIGVHSGHAVGYDQSGYVGGANFGIDWRELFVVRNANYVSNTQSGVWYLERYLWDFASSKYVQRETLLTRTDGRKLGRPTIPQANRDIAPLSVLSYDWYAADDYTSFHGDQGVLATRPSAPLPLRVNPDGMVSAILGAVRDLEALWPLDFTWRLQDATGHGHTLTTPAATQQPVVGGLPGAHGTTATEFDGDDDRLTTDVSPSATFTLFGLICGRATNTPALLVGSTGTNAMAFDVIAGDQQMRWCANQVAGTPKHWPRAFCHNNGWHFFILTFDAGGSTVQLWIGDPGTGALTDKGILPDTDGLNADAGSLCIGGRSSGDSWDGAMNMVGYVPRSLRPDERSSLMKAVST
jgi:hypothetical protein